MKITLSFPTDQEVEQTHRFRTYYNYVCAVGDYIDANEKVFLSDVTASDAFKNIQGGRSFDQTSVSQRFEISFCNRLIFIC